MVPAPVSDLAHKLVVRGVAADEVVSAPLDRLGVPLAHAGRLVSSLQHWTLDKCEHIFTHHEADASPGQDCHCGSHRESKLDQVSGIIVTLDGGWLS